MMDRYVTSCFNVLAFLLSCLLRISHTYLNPLLSPLEFWIWKFCRRIFILFCLSVPFPPKFSGEVLSLSLSLVRESFFRSSSSSSIPPALQSCNPPQILRHHNHFPPLHDYLLPPPHHLLAPNSPLPKDKKNTQETRNELVTRPDQTRPSSTSLNNNNPEFQLLSSHQQLTQNTKHA